MDKNKPKEKLSKELEITKRRLKKLHDWEERYKSLVRASPYAVTLTDLDGNIIDLSRRTLSMYGYRRLDELLGKSAFKLIAPKDRNKAVAYMQKTFEKGHVRNVEYTMVRKNGERFIGELDASLIKDASGNPLAFIATTRDITKQRQSELALKRSEERYKSLFMHNPQAVVTVNMKGVITSCNPTVTKMTGMAKKNLIGKNALKLKALMKQDIPRFGKILVSLVKGKVPEPFECGFFHIDGTKRRALVNIALFDEGDGKRGIQAVVTDITFHKKVDMALRESEEKFRTMVENSLQGIFIIQNFRIVYANYALAHITGYSLKELLSLPWEKMQEIVHPEDQEMVWGRMADRLAGKDVPSRYVFRALRKDGTNSWIEMLSGRIEFKGKPAVQGAVIDITDRQQAEAKIKASLEEKEVMLREIHHRVKNNMQIILSLLRIQSHGVKDKVTQDMFKQSQNRIRSMALIHEALYKSKDLARIDIADYISRMSTHLLTIYRQDLGDVEIIQEAKGIFLDINRAIPCGLVISELLSNCLKHAFPGKRGGKITIRMTKDKKGAFSLVVKDDGIGLPEGLDYRETETLGLQLVTDLVQQLKGSILLKKTLGTEFIINF